jgi:hypothetical protein
MLDTFVKYEMFVAIAKHHNEKWLEFANTSNKNLLNYISFGFYTI